MAEREGFEPPCRLPGKTLSRRPRYDHFGTSPFITTLGAKPLAARSRSPSATPLRRSLAAGGALLRCGAKPLPPSLGATRTELRRDRLLRARGRLRRLPSGARLRPEALYYARGKASSAFARRDANRATARQAAARSRSPSATPLRRSLAAAGALLRSGQSPFRLRSARREPSYGATGCCALAVAFGDSPPALACGRRRFTTLGAKPLPPSLGATRTEQRRDRLLRARAAAPGLAFVRTARPEKVLNHLAAFGFEQAADCFHPVIQRRVLVRPHR